MMDIIADINTNFDLFVFVIVAVLILFFAFEMLESKDLSHAIIFLALTFSGIAIIFLLMNAEFLALIQMSVYTGGVVILFLFALMLTRSEEFNLRGDLNRRVSLLIAFLLISIFIFIVLPLGSGAIWVNGVTPIDAVNASGNGFPYGIAWVGFSLFNYYQIGFLILGLIVISALIGTIYIVKNEPGEDIRVVSPARLTKED